MLFVQFMLVHTIEGSTGAARDFYQGAQAFDYAALKAAYLAQWRNGCMDA
jgi:hypothetical protein